MASDAGGLQRRLGLPSAIAITTGGVIGSGIFLTPLGVAQSLPSEPWIHVLWLALGVICLCGAFAYAELAAMFPEAGGQYAFLREAWGRLPAFLWGWVFFWIITPGSIAALAVACARAVAQLIHLQPSADGTVLAIACAMIAVLAAVNVRGVAAGALLQNVATIAKVGALALLVVAAFAAPAQSSVSAASPSEPLTFASVLTAFVWVFWAYEGWYELPFNAAELKRPERDLPRGLILGLATVVVVYVAVQAAYLRLVPLSEQLQLPSSDAQALPARAFVVAFGPGADAWLLALLALSVFGSANPGLLSSPRAFYAMAQDGLLPRALVAVHPKSGTPVVAIVVQAITAGLQVVVLQSFRDLTEFVVFASFLGYALTVAGVLRLRRTRPLAVRPYRCAGYPVTPLLFMATALAFVAGLLADPAQRANACYGLCILATGLPAYWWITRCRSWR